MSEKVEVEEEKKSPPLTAKEEVSEFAKTALIAVILAVFIRTFFYEPFNIPSESMVPSLEVGDYLFVSKPTYGYSRYSFPFGLAPLSGRVWDKEPERGDIIVFKLPTDTSVDYIKRIIALPGETIEVREGRLYINDQIVERKYSQAIEVKHPFRPAFQIREYEELLPGGVSHKIYEDSDQGHLDNTPKYTVPKGHYFVMGDNRDNSQDSRVMSLVGFVPYENIVGQADFIFFSTNGYANLFEIWKWPWSIRYNRFLMSLKPERSEAAQGT